MTDTRPLDYIKRIRAYYVGLGYGAPYVWAQLDEVTFTRPTKALATARIGIVTTASMFDPTKGYQGPGAA